jgi:hypothetical protein
LLLFASTAGGLRTCTGAAFASLKKFASHFFNSSFGGTEPKEAPYAGTGDSAKIINSFSVLTTFASSYSTA